MPALFLQPAPFSPQHGFSRVKKGCRLVFKAPTWRDLRGIAPVWFQNLFKPCQICPPQGSKTDIQPRGVAPTIGATRRGRPPCLRNPKPEPIFSPQRPAILITPGHENGLNHELPHPSVLSRGQPRGVAPTIGATRRGRPPCLPCSYNRHLSVLILPAMPAPHQNRKNRPLFWERGLISESRHPMQWFQNLFDPVGAGNMPPCSGLKNRYTQLPRAVPWDNIRPFMAIPKGRNPG